MRWPLDVPAELAVGAVTLRPYTADDAAALFAALDDPQVWEHIPKAVPARPDDLDALLRSKLATGNRVTFTIRRGGDVVGMTSVPHDPADPDGVEVGGTQLARATWGTGLNPAVKQLLLDLVLAQGAAWVQLRTDERNERSAAAIRKLPGVRELGLREDDRTRRDGTPRRSLLFRIEHPAAP
jgi:RimJ/RimL family protein N-acetyltransferase